MATTFTVNGREVKTRFGDYALCGYCALLEAGHKCSAFRYPPWEDGWCRSWTMGFRGAIPIRIAKAIAAEAYEDGAEREREEMGAESYREPVRDESRD